MTSVRTQVKQKDFALFAKKQSMLILDNFGLINVFEFDAMDDFLSALLIDEGKRIAVEDIINANLVYALAEKIGLTPGLFSAGDAAILDYIRLCISDDIVEEDKDLLIQELQVSWRRVAHHPLIQGYIPLGVHRSMDNRGVSPLFPAIGAFPFFINNYYNGLVKLFLQKPRASLNRFLQLTELIVSASNGLPYQSNYFYQMEHVIAFLTESKTQFDDNQDIQALLLKVQTKYNNETAPWLRNVLGWVQHELEDIKKSIHAESALRNLLERKEPLSENIELASALEELWTYLHWPQDRENTLMSSSKFPRTNVSAANESFFCTQAIEYCVLYYARGHGMTLYQRPPIIDAPMFYLAGGSEAEETLLLNYLADNNNSLSLKPYEIYAISRKCKLLELKERINYELQIRMQAQSAPLLMPMPHMNFARRFVQPMQPMPVMVPMTSFLMTPSFTPHWSRLNDMLRGNSDIRPALAASASTDAQAPDMAAILNLRKENDQGCCIC